MLCWTGAEASDTEHETQSWLLFSIHTGSCSTMACSGVAHHWCEVTEPRGDHGTMMVQEVVGERCYEGGIAQSLCFNSQLETLWPGRFGKPRCNVCSRKEAAIYVQKKASQSEGGIAYGRYCQIQRGHGPQWQLLLQEDEEGNKVSLETRHGQKAHTKHFCTRAGCYHSCRHKGKTAKH